MRISISLFLAALVVLRLLCLTIAALFVLLAVKSFFDATIAMPLATSLLSALAFGGAALGIGFVRRALLRRAGLSEG